MIHADNFRPKTCLTEEKKINHSDVIDLFTQICEQGGEESLHLRKEKCTLFQCQRH